MGNTFIFFVIAAIIIGSVVSSISKMNAAKTKQNTQNNQARPSAPKQGGGVELAKEIKGDFRAEADRTAQIKQAAYEKKHMTTSSVAKPKNFRDEANLTANKKQSDYDKKQHTHPASQRQTRVERAYVESSIDSHHSEGCEKHYYDRFVAITEEKYDINSEPLSELAKIIVIGEAINTPGHKKFGR